MKRGHYVRFFRWFDEIGLDDLPLVGGKNASLGELGRSLSGSIKVPEGFAVTSEAYRRFVDSEPVLSSAEGGPVGAADADSRRDQLERHQGCRAKCWSPKPPRRIGRRQ